MTSCERLTNSLPKLSLIAQFLFTVWKKDDGRPKFGGVSIRSRNGAPSRTGCVVNGQMTKARNKLVRPPPPAPLPGW